MSRTEIPYSKLKANPFDLFGTGWFILTAGDFAKGSFNGMTISWGSFGTLWGKPFVMIVVRPQRHTLPFMDSSDSFTLSAFGPQYKEALGFFGSKSGAEYDKFKETGLTAEAALKVASPAIAEADLVVECRKTYADRMKPECFLARENIETWYPGNDFHKIFFGEVIAVSAAERYC